MSDNIIVEEKPVEPSHSIAEGFNLPPTPPTDNKTMTYEQLEHLKTLIKCAKRMNKGGFKKCVPNGIRGLLFKGKGGEEKAVVIDPDIWTAFLKYDIRLKVETPF
jgi:hypothetical protein